MQATIKRIGSSQRWYLHELAQAQVGRRLCRLVEDLWLHTSRSDNFPSLECATFFLPARATNDRKQRFRQTIAMIDVPVRKWQVLVQRFTTNRRIPSKSLSQRSLNCLIFNLVKKYSNIYRSWLKSKLLTSQDAWQIFCCLSGKLQLI